MVAKAKGKRKEEDGAEQPTAPATSVKAKKEKGGKSKPNPWKKPGAPDDSEDVRERLIAPHVESFDWFLSEGMQLAVSNLLPLSLGDPDGGPRLHVTMTSARVSHPAKADNARDQRVLPKECRELRASYKGALFVTLRLQINDLDPVEFDRKLGDIPIMVRSQKCNLFGFNQRELIRAGEEPWEFGGYFIANGNEKAVRLLSLMRRNYVMALVRPSFTKRGPQYTKFGCMMRCVRPDQSSITLVLHYLSSGNCALSVKIRKQEYLIPAMVVLKALTGSSDHQIFEHVVQSDPSNTFVSDRVEVALRECNKLMGLRTKEDYLAFMGQRFKQLLVKSLLVQENTPDAEAGQAFLDHFLFVHLDNDLDKWHMLVLMMQKLYALVSGDVIADNPDSLHCQEVLLPGHLFNMMLKEKLQDYLAGLREVYLKDLRAGSTHHQKVDLSSRGYVDSLFMRNGLDIGRKLEYFLSTGNLVSQTGLDLMQVSGYTIVAERLNFLRYLSHYRSIHRGQFFTTMKSTAVRKLLPESWGFVCPVHTPDGGPCGLLNHLTSVCSIPSYSPRPEELQRVLAAVFAFGAAPIGSGGLGVMLDRSHLPVTLDGKLIGRIHHAEAPALVEGLRRLKTGAAAEAEALPEGLEIAHVPQRTNGLWPGVFMFCSSARMLRPVRQLFSGRTEWIGTFEQIHMDIAVRPSEVDPKQHTHMELSPMNMLSVVASCTPFSDMNQSPRNMYQCQMGKQTMGTPLYAYGDRVDNKIYRIITPQVPLVRNQAQDTFRMDDYPTGTNAIVAVISYTGFDMEDAMIISKGSYDRGFGNGHVYTHTLVDLAKAAPPGSHFSNPPGKGHVPHLDSDGLPLVGSTLTQGMEMYRCVDPATGKSKTALHKSQEPVLVDQVRLLGDGGSKPLSRCGIKLRYDRKPIIGDKFSSRHGQKGVLSVIWPSENMPFTETGMVPDVIINPNAFPSRMTIGMLVESMAGKAGAMHGYHPDSTPFRFDEQHRAIDYFGEQLSKAGYNYYGTEVMHSGTSGQLMEAEIFIGVVYYQRLRHMVSDKYQVRATGPVNNYTRQPVKGRKAGGGVRFGEMERDGLLAHGASFLLRDRLLTCSDITTADVCGKCGSMIAPLRQPPTLSGVKGKTGSERVTCRTCRDGSEVKCVTVPFVFRYLLAELAAMNIRVSCDL